MMLLPQQMAAKQNALSATCSEKVLLCSPRCPYEEQSALSALADSFGFAFLVASRCLLFYTIAIPFPKMEIWFGLFLVLLK